MIKKLNESNVQLNISNDLGHGVWHLIQERHVIETKISGGGLVDIKCVFRMQQSVSALLALVSVRLLQKLHFFFFSYLTAKELGAGLKIQAYIFLF